MAGLIAKQSLGSGTLSRVVGSLETSIVRQESEMSKVDSLTHKCFLTSAGDLRLMSAAIKRHTKVFKWETDEPG
jgi:hypothetical protein